MTTFARTLELSLHRALGIAQDQRVRLSTLEHLLLALLEDPDAVEVLQACNCDLQVLRDRLWKYLNSNLEDLKWKEGEEWTPSTIKEYALATKSSENAVGTRDALPTQQLQRVIQRAVIHVQSSGREEVNGANVIVAIFAERESPAATFLIEQDITRYDAVNYISHGISKRPQARGRKISNDLEDIERSISKTAESAPNFHVSRGRIRYQEQPASAAIRERKQLTRERCTELQKLCSSRANEQPDLKNLINKYADALKSLKPDRGAYKLFIIGLDIETLLRIKERSPADIERNPPLDADLLFAVQSLIIAHAGLISLYPDVQSSYIELDQYRQQSEAIDALRDRILDPVLNQLAHSSKIFDQQTQQHTLDIIALDDREKLTTLPSRGVASTKHAWLRGALASIGQYLLTQSKKGLAAARDAAIKETVAAAARNSDRLLAAIMVFFEGARSALLSLSESLINSFGWIKSLLNVLGLL